MKRFIHVIIAGVMVLALTFSGCANRQKDNSKEDSVTLEAERGEHMREAHGEGEGEESGTQLSLDQSYDEIRKGTHLVLAYNEESNSFSGSVKNVSDKVQDRVRIEVHLSNGTELGPTTQVDLQPGEKRLVLLEAESTDFTSWSTHAEVGDGEHGHGHSHEGEGEHGHSHDGEGAHEHN